METGALTAQADPALPVYPLRKLIMAQFAHAMRQAIGEQALHRDELLGYLSSIQQPEERPLDAVLQQTDAIGDPAMPEPPQLAILEWLADAFEWWQQEYPLEQPLAGELRRLMPVAAALAVTDPNFLTPGQHPLHRLLDTAQDYAIGWQPSLGRAGTALQKQLGQAIDRVLGWFVQRNVDLSATADELVQAAQREQARAHRMTERLVATERGQQRAAEARRLAAQMINAELMLFPGTAEVRDFLTGPWYESAQLVLLKFGPESDEWRSMKGATHDVLQSLQRDSLDRAQLIELSSRLPAELKRWLLSLQHDPDSADRAIKPLEAAHLALLRGSELKLFNIDPILVQDTRKRGTGRVPDAVRALEVGSWFRVRHAPGQALRVRLALKSDDEQQLLFVNRAGVKALQIGYLDFTRLLEQRRAQRLRHGSSFSRALVRAAGIESDSAFEELATEEQRRREARRRAEEQEHRRALAEPDEINTTAAEADQPTLKTEVALDSVTQADRRVQDAAAILTSAEDHLPRDARAESIIAAAEAERDAREPAIEPPPRSSEAERQARDAADRLAEEAAQARARARDNQQPWLDELSEEPPPPAETEPAPDEPGISDFLHSTDGGTLLEEAERLARLDGDLAAAPGGKAHTDEPGQASGPSSTAQEVRSQPPSPHGALEDTATPSPPESATDEQREPQVAASARPAIPMGAWLGFHDGEAPLMAKLAVHDPELDIYIFVNREGIKMRQLSGAELQTLVQQEMVDILETRSSFRSEVDQLRENND